MIWFSPAGPRLTQKRVQQLAASPGAVLVCGRYEGVDQRFIDAHVDEELSLGDYVLSGGELPALTLIDAVALNPQPLPPGPDLSRIALNPQPLPPGPDIRSPGPARHRHSRSVRRWPMRSHWLPC